MASKFLNLDTDNTLGGASASNEKVASQKAVKEYVDSSVGSPSFANIQGSPSDNAALASDLGDKENVANKTQTIDGNSTTTEYPSAKAVWDLIQDFKYMG